jgi:hypothetical protein
MFSIENSSLRLLHFMPSFYKEGSILPFFYLFYTTVLYIIIVFCQMSILYCDKKCLPRVNDIQYSNQLTHHTIDVLVIPISQNIKIEQNKKKNYYNNHHKHTTKEILVHHLPLQLLDPTMSFLPKDYKPDETGDILCGRGNVYSTRPGNQYFQRVIRANRCIYQDAITRPDKIKVVDKILKEIHRNGVKFTRMSNNSNKRWYELDDVAAHQKIGHAIRDTIRLHEKEEYIRCNSSKSSIAIKKQNNKTMKNKRNNSTTTMDKILRKSLESVDFLDNNVPSSSLHETTEQQIKQQQQQQTQQQTQQIQKQQRHLFSFSSIEITTTSSGFLLTNEYPDTHFEFTASAFFGGDDDEKKAEDDDTDYSYNLANEIISLSSQ